MLEEYKTPFTPSEMGTNTTSTAELHAHVPENGGKVAYVPVSELPAHQTQPIEMYAPHKP